MKPEDLKLCIEALKALRQEMHQEIDTSVIDRLDEVILQLEESLEAGEQDVMVPTGTRHMTLEVLADVFRVATNLTELVRLWTGML